MPAASGAIGVAITVRKSGLTLHLTLGNHDHRGNFMKALPEDAAAAKDGGLADRHVTLIESARADLYMLDSLDVTNNTPGVLGEGQLAWLAKSLDSSSLLLSAMALTKSVNAPMVWPEAVFSRAATDAAFRLFAKFRK